MREGETWERHWGRYGGEVPGTLTVFISPECGMSDAEHERRLSRTEEALGRSRPTAYWYAAPAARPLDGAAFTCEWARDTSRDERSWVLRGHTGQAGSGAS